MTKDQDCNCDCASTFEPMQSYTLELSPDQVRQLIQQKFARALAYHQVATAHAHRVLHLNREQLDSDTK